MKTKNLLTLAIVGTLLFWTTSATSDYIHYKTVDGTGTITICDPDSNGTKCITMKDRNEWATESDPLCKSIDYQCYPGREYEWFESYESCVRECMEDWGNPNFYCEKYCTSDFKWYENYDECDNNIRDDFLQCINNSGVYGYHYQWWNNHGFAIGCWRDWCSDTVTNNAISEWAVWDNIYNNHWYDWWITNFMLWSDYWQNNSHYDWLRWWANDSQANNRWYDITGNVALNVTWRRWPCGEWYHVPSIGEWNQVLEYWVENSNILIHEKAIFYDGVWLSIHNCIDEYSCWDENRENEVDCDSEDAYYFGCGNGYEDNTIWFKFWDDFKIPFAGHRQDVTAKVKDIGYIAMLKSSSPVGPNGPSSAFNLYLEAGAVDSAFSYDRAEGFSVRCFKNYALTFPIVETTDDENFTATVWNQTYTWLDDIMEVTTNNIEEETMENKPVVWEVSVSFGENVTAKFNKLVQVNVPVSDEERVIVKVKHAWSDEYNFDWLTTNRNASCNDNWRVANNADKYNWSIIDVVDGYATIYTCEASSFIALWVENWWDSKVIVNIAEFNEWRNTCTWDNYVFNNIVAWPTTVTWNLVKTFQCAFWEAGGKAVTIQLSWDLEDWNGNTISSWNVKIKNSTWAATPSNVQSWTTAITTYTPLNQIVTLFNKTAWVIWRAEWSWVDIEITVLWWTPDGTYNWTLVLTY